MFKIYIKISRRSIINLMITVTLGVFLQGFANAQSANILEMQCFSDIQGKVAWNQAGSKTWDEGRLKTLCNGTSNPKATAYCVTAEIRLHKDLSRGIEACKSRLVAIDSSASNTDTTANKPTPVNFGSLINVFSDGCSCSAVNLFDKSRPEDNPGILFITDLGDNSPAYFNVDGIDYKFLLKNRGGRPEILKIGTTYQDVYETDGMTATIKYIDQGSQCGDSENCESRKYKVTVSVSKKGYTRAITTPGVCGC